MITPSIFFIITLKLVSNPQRKKASSFVPSTRKKKGKMAKMMAMKKSSMKMAMKMSSMKKMGSMKVNEFFKLMLAAKAAKKPSFVYKGTTYVGKPHPTLKLLYKKK
mmetsp:Transcript_11238/g.27473  ORF Transcript_11238/g.27473 Transcript_11238/m.27473 type:complete len:106 (+) Transcript_11238:157-474(+)